MRRIRFLVRRDVSVLRSLSAALMAAAVWGLSPVTVAGIALARGGAPAARRTVHARPDSTVGARARRGKKRKPSTGAEAQLAALLSAGEKRARGVTVQMGEVLGVSAPGSGEIIRMHSAWNTSQHVAADAVTVLIGRLGANLPADQVVSTISVTKGASTWIKPTVAGAKWTYERLPESESPGARFGSTLLRLIGRATVKRLSSSRHSGSSWRISYSSSDLQALGTLQGQLARAPKLTAHGRSLLAGERLKVGDLELKLDRADRVIGMRLGGELIESRADATARHLPYPEGGADGVVLLNLAYTYGGRLKITPPPSRDVLNPTRPLR